MEAESFMRSLLWTNIKEIWVSRSHSSSCLSNPNRAMPWNKKRDLWGGTEGKKPERKKRKSSEVLTSLFIRIYRVQSRRGGEGG